MDVPAGADAVYAWLIGAAPRHEADEFDVHVLASILAIAIDEAQSENLTVPECAGLSPSALRALAMRVFPPIAQQLTTLAGDRALAIDSEEQSVVDLLWMYASCGSALQRDLAAMIARRCLRPHHLWQDLGLRNRGELSALMQRHFSGLARRNQGDMKWKKFFYRTICGAEGFTICASPICSDCDDYDNCFGAESGAAFLAPDTESQQRQAVLF